MGGGVGGGDGGWGGWGGVGGSYVVTMGVLAMSNITLSDECPE